MSNERLVEDHVRAAIELASGQRDLTGEVMDEILRATGCTRREPESVLAERFTPLRVGQSGIPNVWTVPGAAAAEKNSRSPLPLGI